MTREVEPGDLNDILRERLQGRSPALFLDYDGTLTSIVDHPDQASLDAATRRTLKRVVKTLPVYVISGRDLEDVRKRVNVDGIECIGSHGFHLLDTQPELDQEALDDAVVELNLAANELEQWLDYIEGVVIQRKKYSFAVHYRTVDRDDLKQIASAAEDMLERYGAVTSKKGKKVIEFVPDIPWDKGSCFTTLLSRMKELSGNEKDFYPVYIGDDLTDEDVFTVLSPDNGLGVLVAETPRASAAEFRLTDPDAVQLFLEKLV